MAEESTVPDSAPSPARPAFPADALSSCDLSGLVYGFVFQPGEPGRPIDTDGALAWLRSQEREGASPGFAWLHFSLSAARSTQWLREHAGLPASYFDLLKEGGSSTQVEAGAEHLLAVIQDVDYDFCFEAEQISTLWVCIRDRLMVSARMHPLRSVERLRQDVRGGECFSSPVAVLAHLLVDQAEVLQDIVRKAAARLDTLEEDLLAGHMLPKRYHLGVLRRVLVRLRRLLSPEPRSIFRLLNRPPAWFDAADAADLRTARDEFSEVLDELALVQERAKLLQEELLAHTNEQTNRSVFLLTMVTVVALPINIVAGLLGMNVGGVPLNQDPNGFWVVISLVAFFTGVAVWFAFFRRGR